MPVVTLRKIFYLLKKKFFAYAVDSEGLVAADPPGLPRAPLTGSAAANVCFLRHAGWWSVCGLQSAHSVTSCKFYRAVRSHFSKLASFADISGQLLSLCGSWKECPLSGSACSGDPNESAGKRGAPSKAPNIPQVCPMLSLWPPGLLVFS